MVPLGRKDLDPVFEVLEEWEHVLQHPDLVDQHHLLLGPKGPTP